MKKIILLLSFFCFFNAVSQQKVAQKVAELINRDAKFEHFTIFNVSQNSNSSETTKVIDKASFVTLDFSIINEIVQKKSDNIEIEIPYDNRIIELQLYKVNPFAEGFHVDTDKSRFVNYEKGVYYRGIVKNDNNSVVSFNFFKNKCNGIVSNNTLSNLVIAKLERQGNVSDYIIYRDADLKILNNSDCHTKEIPQKINSNPKKSALGTQSNRCATVYFEIDNTIYTQNNSDEIATTDWMTSIFNNVQTIYNNDGITVSLKSIFIWTTLDPYEGIGTSSSDYLFKFNQVRPIFDGDVGQLVGIDPGGLGGVAVTINGLCSSNNFSYSDVYFNHNTVPTYSWTIEVITHELGHLLGSPHTHGCYWNGNNTAIDGCGQQAGYSEGNCVNGPIPSSSVKGTIMSYCHLVNGVGINFNNGFGPQPTARILAAVNGGSCLSSDCVTTCINNITSVTSSNIGNTTANINWTEAGGTATSQVAVYPFSGTAGTWTTPSSNTYMATGLTPNTYYKAVIRNNCSAGLIGPEINIVFATSGDFCSGILLTDSGGSNGNYTDLETVVRTIIPSNPNAKAKITFSSFDLENNYDYLTVYNGSDTSFPDLSSGGFTGNTIPAPIESTASDGSLTLKFYSDGGVVAAGYEATVSCLTLGTNEFSSAIDFSYFPNPTNNTVTINSKTEINEVSIFNLEGQLLYNNKLNNLGTTIDISSFSNGTYFFKLKFNEKEVNFKVLKM